MNREKHPDGFRVRHRPPITQEYFESQNQYGYSLVLRKKRMRNLQDVSVLRPISPSKVWNHCVAVSLLYLAAKVSLCYPCTAVPQLIRPNRLIKEILEHDFFRRRVAVDGSLANRKENVVVHLDRTQSSAINRESLTRDERRPLVTRKTRPLKQFLPVRLVYPSELI
jgi:hypothetical protein